MGGNSTHDLAAGLQGRAAISLVRMEVIELLLRVFQPLGSVAVLLLQQRHNGRHILQIPGMCSALRVASPLGSMVLGCLQASCFPKRHVLGSQRCLQ